MPKNQFFLQMTCLFMDKARVIGSWLTLALTVSLTLRQDVGQRIAPKT